MGARLGVAGLHAGVESIRRSGVARAVTALVELALPLECGGCRRPGSGWCQTCAEEILASAFAGGPRLSQPSPCPPGLPPVWSTRLYAGVLRSAVVQSKDGGRRDLLAVLAPLLADAILAALVSDAQAREVIRSGNGPVFVIPVPSSAASVRRRGEAFTAALTSLALAGSGLEEHQVLMAPALRVRRAVADQSGLGSRERAANLDHAMESRPAWRAALPGTCCLLVDDVLTTGATLAEAARALSHAGAGHVLGATLAATARRQARAPTGP